jgi:hypothetical protein
MLPVRAPGYAAEYHNIPSDASWGFTLPIRSRLMLIGTATLVTPIPSILHLGQPQRGRVLPGSGDDGETMAASSGKQPGYGLSSGYPKGFIHVIHVRSTFSLRSYH